jgi:hypothetical protein
MTVLCWTSKWGGHDRVRQEKSRFGAGEEELRAGGKPSLVVFIMIRCGDYKLVCVFLCVCVCVWGGGIRVCVRLCVCEMLWNRSATLRFMLCTIKKTHAPSE